MRPVYRGIVTKPVGEWPRAVHRRKWKMPHSRLMHRKYLYTTKRCWKCKVFRDKLQKFIPGFILILFYSQQFPYEYFILPLVDLGYIVFGQDKIIYVNISCFLVTAKLAELFHVISCYVQFCFVTNRFTRNIHDCLTDTSVFIYFLWCKWYSVSKI